MAEVVYAPISRLRRHYQRWGRRWARVAADSFNRIPEEGLSVSDTGHTWHQHLVNADADTWGIIGGKARRREATGGSSGTYADVFTGESDVLVRCQITLGTVAGNGVGITARGHLNHDTLYFTYQGGTTWKINRVLSGVTSTLATNASGTSLTAGTQYLFEFLVSGTSLTGYVDGVQQVTTTSSSLQTQMRHGIFVVDNIDHLFDNFQVFPV